MSNISGFDNETKAFMQRLVQRSQKTSEKNIQKHKVGSAHTRAIEALFAEQNPGLHDLSLRRLDLIVPEIEELSLQYGSLPRISIDSHGPVYFQYLLKKNPQALQLALEGIADAAKRKPPHLAKTTEAAIEFIKGLSLDKIQELFIDIDPKLSKTEFQKLSSSQNLSRDEQELLRSNTFEPCITRAEHNTAFGQQLLSQRDDREQVASLIYQKLKSKQLSNENQILNLQHMLLGLRLAGHLGKENNRYDGYLIKIGNDEINREVLLKRLEENGAPSQQDLAFYLKTKLDIFDAFMHHPLKDEKYQYQEKVTEMIVNPEYEIEDRARVFIAVFNYHRGGDPAYKDILQNLLKNILAKTNDFADLVDTTVKLSGRSGGYNLFTDFGSGLTWNVGVEYLIELASKNDNQRVKENAGLILRTAEKAVEDELTNYHFPDQPNRALELAKAALAS